MLAEQQAQTQFIAALKRTADEQMTGLITSMRAQGVAKIIKHPKEIQDNLRSG